MAVFFHFYFLNKGSFEKIRFSCFLSFILASAEIFTIFLGHHVIFNCLA